MRTELARRTGRPASPLLGDALAVEALLAVVALLTSLAYLLDGKYGPWYYYSAVGADRVFTVADASAPPTCELFTGDVPPGGALGTLEEQNLAVWLVFALVMYAAECVQGALEAYSVVRDPDEYVIAAYGLVLLDRSAVDDPDGTRDDGNGNDDEADADEDSLVRSRYLCCRMAAKPEPDATDRIGKYRIVFVLMMGHMEAMRPLFRWVLLAGFSHIFDGGGECRSERYTYSVVPVLPGLLPFLACTLFLLYCCFSEAWRSIDAHRRAGAASAARAGAVVGNFDAELLPTPEKQMRAARIISVVALVYVAAVFVAMLALIAGDGNSAASFQLPQFRLPPIDTVRVMTLIGTLARAGAVVHAYKYGPPLPAAAPVAGGPLAASKLAAVPPQRSSPSAHPPAAAAAVRGEASGPAAAPSPLRDAEAGEVVIGEF